MFASRDTGGASTRENAKRLREAEHGILHQGSRNSGERKGPLI